MEGAFETVEDCYGVGRAAGDVVARVVGVDDGETVVVLVCQAVDVGLAKVSSDCGRSEMKTDLADVADWSR